MRHEMFYELEAGGSWNSWAEIKQARDKIPLPANPEYTFGTRILWAKIPRVAAKYEIIPCYHAEFLLPWRSIEILRREGFTGFEVEKVGEVKWKWKKRSDSSPPPELWRLLVTGWGGFPGEKSNLKLTIISTDRFKLESKYFRPEYLVDLDQWDGSDFFRVWGIGRYIFISRRLRDFLVRNKWKKIICHPISKLHEYSSSQSRKTSFSIYPLKVQRRYPQYIYPERVLGEIEAYVEKEKKRLEQEEKAKKNPSS